MQSRRMIGYMLSIAAVITFAASSFAQPPDGPPPGYGGPGSDLIERHGRQLQLSTAQREQIRQIHERARGNAEPIEEQIQPLFEQLGKVVEAATFDTEAARAVLSQIALLETELGLIRARAESDVYNLLTAAQKARLTELRAADAFREDSRPQRSGR